MQPTHFIWRDINDEWIHSEATLVQSRNEDVNHSIAAFMLLTSDHRNGQLRYGLQTVWAVF